MNSRSANLDTSYHSISGTRSPQMGGPQMGGPQMGLIGQPQIRKPKKKKRNPIGAPQVKRNQAWQPKRKNQQRRNHVQKKSTSNTIRKINRSCDPIHSAPVRRGKKWSQMNTGEKIFQIFVMICMFCILGVGIFELLKFLKTYY